MAAGAESVMDLARELRRHPGRRAPAGLDPEEVAFTHVDASLPPGEVLDRVRATAAGELLRAEGERVNDPAAGPDLVAVHASAGRLVDAYVSSSLWEAPKWHRTAGEVEVRFLFEEGGARAFQAVGVAAGPEERPVLYAFAYDEQRAGMGYDGDGRTTVDADDAAVERFLRAVRSVVDDD